MDGREVGALRVGHRYGAAVGLADQRAIFAVELALDVGSHLGRRYVVDDGAIVVVPLDVALGRRFGLALRLGDDGLHDRRRRRDFGFFSAACTAATLRGAARAARAARAAAAASAARALCGAAGALAAAAAAGLGPAVVIVVV